MKKQKNLKIRVLFNASVILSGFYSPKGGSAKVLGYVKNKKLVGIISEIILDEVLRHSDKVNLSKEFLDKNCHEIFEEIKNAPSKELVNKYTDVVLDLGDRHVLASCEENKINYLVTLDKKHLLVLKNKIKGLKILTPAELIAKLHL